MSTDVAGPPTRPLRRGDADVRTGPMRPYYRYSRILCQMIFVLVFRGRIFGARNIPSRGPVLLACNHQSFLDPVLATLAVPRECHYMARDTLFRRPLFRRLIESLNAFPVRRGSADIAAVKETLRRLRAGAVLTAFPEATRTPDGSLQPMKPGVVLMARKAGVPLVPTLILGAYEVWPRQARLPMPKPILVAYGEAIWPEELEGLSDEQAVALLQGRFEALLRRYSGHAALRHTVRKRGYQ